MKNDTKFFRNVCNIAIPVTLQSMLQCSFSIIDQVMIGQLGSESIAGIGLAGKFSSIFSVLISAIACVAGIMIAQYIGKKDEREVNRSFWINMMVAGSLAIIFTIMCSLFSTQIMGIYTKDPGTRRLAAGYMRIIAITFIPIAGASLLSTMLRCMENAKLPLFASIIAVILNTGINYVLIFGKFGFSKLGVNGAAIATAISQVANLLFILFAFIVVYRKNKMTFKLDVKLSKSKGMQYLAMLIPMLVTEFLWSLGENVYAAIYGHMGTDACAAMTLTTPIQCLLIGALSGLSQAASIIIGKLLGKKKYDEAYRGSKRLMLYGFAGSVILSILLFIFSRVYVDIYNVDNSVKTVAMHILFAFAIISPVKVQNMILGGGIIRSGGKTRYVMWIDIVGTWVFGVPLGLIAANVLHLSIPYVYFILSLEECIRLVLGFILFRRKRWMNSLED